MDKVSILHLITAAKNASPFDVNMAFDAGFEKIMPYTGVELKEIAGLVQDAIFSRSSNGIKRQSIFIGGRDIDLAMDMLESARKAMVPPFEISVCADPSGAFTTAAAMMGKVEQSLLKSFGADLNGRKVSVFGATGPVGGCVALIAAKNGAIVELVAHRSLADVQARAESYNKRYDTTIGFVDGSNEVLKMQVLEHTEIALCTAAAGVRVLTREQLAGSSALKIVADVNAVPPTGVEGVDVMADAAMIAGTRVLGTGALAIGRLKYDVQQDLLKQLLQTDKKHYLDFMSAFEVARRLLK